VGHHRRQTRAAQRKRADQNRLKLFSRRA
jgi:hypothetical protein